jgi:hypothetical protein
MKHFLWQFQNLNVPMMEDSNSTLYTTTPILASALGVEVNSLRQIFKRHQDELDGICVQEMHANGDCVTDSDATSFLQANKETFGLKYVRGDMHLWSEDDMILIAGLTRTETGKAFRKEMVKAIKAQARKDLITKEYFDSVVAQLVQQNQALQVQVNEIREAQPHLNDIASNAGHLLRNQRFTKPFRS